MRGLVVFVAALLLLAMAYLCGYTAGENAVRRTVPPTYAPGWMR